MKTYKPAMTASLPTGNRLFVYKTGEVRVSGVDYESPLELHAINKDYIVVKHHGGSHWSGVGEQSYHRTAFHVWKIDDMVPGARFTTYSASPVTSFCMRKPNNNEN